MFQTKVVDIIKYLPTYRHFGQPEIAQNRYLRKN